MFMGFEEELQRCYNVIGSEEPPSGNWPPEIDKALRVLLKLRRIARNQLQGFTHKYTANYTEHLISLLVATLNVVRLRHIEEERKLHAMLSAAQNVILFIDSGSPSTIQWPTLDTFARQFSSDLGLIPDSNASVASLLQYCEQHVGRAAQLKPWGICHFCSAFVPGNLTICTVSRRIIWSYYREIARC